MVTSKISDFPEILLREIYPHYYLHMLPQGLVVYYNTSNSSNSSDNDATTAATDDHLEELQTFHPTKIWFLRWYTLSYALLLLHNELKHRRK